jgi:hypothetical protein
MGSARSLSNWKVVTRDYHNVSAAAMIQGIDATWGAAGRCWLRCNRMPCLD